MAIFKCKMCGGTLEINNNETVAVCEYCGTKQTLPKLDDEKRVLLYDRANHFRRENEFDKAMGIYEMILSDDKEDCESYWGLVLCRYGIEYVEDPRTHKRIPTVNRAQFTSIFDDDDYKNAIKYADGYQKDVYEAEATVIDKIQKGILEISNKEEPFDVFICYKETDSHGNRTQDSVYAQDIYTALTKEGYKVFFSRITLEDKLGSAYEPYIFAALNSAKVMLVVGTEKDNFNAVWVKNEWSRYISLIKSGKDKTLIPVYKDISPYDMPEEFQYLQSQDLSKVGAIQDIVRGVKKLIEVGAITETQTAETTSVIVETMLKRATEALANKEWQKASRCYDNVLDYDDKNELAYIGKMLIDFKVSSLNELSSLSTQLDSNKYFKYLIDNARSDTKERLLSIEDEIEKHLLEERELVTEKIKKRIKIVLAIVTLFLIIFVTIIISKNVIIPNIKYNKAMSLIKAGNLDEAYTIFNDLGEYKDATDKAIEIRLSKTKAQMENIKIGDYIKFGVYEQDNNLSNGGEYLEWLVLEIKDGKALLISKYAIDCKPFSVSYKNVNWGTCSLRYWLNNDFVEAAFSAKEAAMIFTTSVEYEFVIGNGTQDRVYLLSTTEVNKYFDSDNERQCKPTAFAIEQGVYTNDVDGNCWWWLRSLGNKDIYATGVEYGGVVSESGRDARNEISGVRPALWITLDS